MPKTKKRKPSSHPTLQLSPVEQSNTQAPPIKDEEAFFADWLKREESSIAGQKQDDFFLPFDHWAQKGTAAPLWTKKLCDHDALHAVNIGGFDVWFGACNDIDEETIEQFDLILPLNGYMPNAYFGRFLPIICCELADRGGVPKGWKHFVESIIRQIKGDMKVLAYCTGGHGRTGTMGASLIALMEPETEDPIAAMRERHCSHAVESLAQAEAIFALKGQLPPATYIEELKPKYLVKKAVVDPTKIVTTQPQSAPATAAVVNPSVTKK
jgi:hypothetical protein